MERWLSWSKAHDWKSCIPYKGIKGSNPFLSAKTGILTDSGFLFASFHLRCGSMSLQQFHKSLQQAAAYDNISANHDLAKVVIRMKKKCPVMIAFAFGAFPFLVGGIQNWYMTSAGVFLPYRLVSLAVLLLWGCIAFFLDHHSHRTKSIMVSLNLIAAFDLLLVGIQELILHAYWMNDIGLWSQLFYLPVLNLGFNLTNWSPSVFTAYAACFVLMAAASFAGCKLSEMFQK